MPSSKDLPSAEELGALSLDAMVAYTRNVLAELSERAPRDCRALASNFLRALDGPGDERTSLALYRTHFSPLAEQFFMHHSTKHGPTVSAQCKVTALCIVRINGAERLAAGHAPVLPDDVREVTPAMVAVAVAQALG